MFRTSYISNMDDLSFNYNTFLELIKTQDFENIQKITFSLYSFSKITIQDILFGKKIFKYLRHVIEDSIKKYNNNLAIKNSSYKKKNNLNSNLPEMISNNNIYKIITLFLFNNCKMENDKTIVLSCLDYISDVIKEEKYKEQYYDILLQSFFLFNNEQIRQTVITLLSQTFIKNIENQSTFDFIE